MPDDASTTLAILAGGAGSRMGRPKAQLDLRGRPILQHVMQRAAWRGPTLLVTTPGREQPPGSDLFTREAIDPMPDIGPLRGLLTALEACATPLLVVGTVDMPCVGFAHFEFVVSSLKSRPGCLGLMLRRAIDGGEQRIEPFPSAFRVAANDVVAAELAAGRRSVHRLLEQPGFAAIDAPQDWPPTTWTNLNRPDDLERFLASPD